MLETQHDHKNRHATNSADTVSIDVQVFFFCQQSLPTITQMKQTFVLPCINRSNKLSKWFPPLSPAAAALGANTPKNPVPLSYSPYRGQGLLPNYTILLLCSSNKTMSEQPLCQIIWAREQRNLKPLFRLNNNHQGEFHTKQDQHFPVSHCLNLIGANI